MQNASTSSHQTAPRRHASDCTTSSSSVRGSNLGLGGLTRSTPSLPGYASLFTSENAGEGFGWGDMMGDVVRRWPAVFWVAAGAVLLGGTIAACGGSASTGPGPSGGDGRTWTPSSATLSAASGRASSAGTGASASAQAAATGVSQRQGKLGTAVPAIGRAGPAMSVGGDSVPPPSGAMVASISVSPGISSPPAATSPAAPSSAAPPPAAPAPRPLPDPPAVTPLPGG